jgi:ornithine carbamoyltransferase
MALPPIQVIGDSNTMKEKINSQQKFFLYVGDNIGSTWVSFQQRRFFMKSSQP